VLVPPNLYIHAYDGAGGGGDSDGPVGSGGGLEGRHGGLSVAGAPLSGVLGCVLKPR